MSQLDPPLSPREILANSDILGFANPLAAQPGCGDADAGTGKTPDIKTSLAKSGKTNRGNAFGRPPAP